jgi:hypothetical protein
MRKLLVIILLVSIVACSGEKEQGNMIVQGQIKGLKKGTLYLQKMVDTLVVSVDSISVLGQDTFTLSDDVDSPEMYYLNFDTNNSQQKIMFFGQQGTITINDEVKSFGVNTKIEGSANQKVYEDYLKVTNKFQGKQLDLLEANFKALKAEDQKAVDSIREVSERYVKRKYLYTIQFALQHPDSEATPYIALTELQAANVKYLDSINNNLSEKVKKSTYGKQLDEFIARIKKAEQKEQN